MIGTSVMKQLIMLERFTKTLLVLAKKSLKPLLLYFLGLFELATKFDKENVENMAYFPNYLKYSLFLKNDGLFFSRKFCCRKLFFNLVFTLFRILVRYQNSRCSWRYMFFKISQNLQENNCGRVSFSVMLKASCLQLYSKRGSGTIVSCEFCKIFKNIIFIEHLWWLLLTFIF